jgi:hypothetical protein
VQKKRLLKAVSLIDGTPAASVSNQVITTGADGIC